MDGLAGDFKVRVGMMTPNMVTDMQAKLIDAFRSDKIFKFLHLPVQSGDDETLKRMRRFYTAEQFKAIVDAFRAEFPDLTLATDVIVGFPGETAEAFENTLKLLRKLSLTWLMFQSFLPDPKRRRHNARWLG